jgi:hypothetical protein
MLGESSHLRQSKTISDPNDLKSRFVIEIRFVIVALNTRARARFCGRWADSYGFPLCPNRPNH